MGLVLVLGVLACQRRDLDALKAEAGAGDVAAAYELYTYYDRDQHDADASAPWLARAAELGHPRAQLVQADLIWRYKRPHTRFGPTAAEAVRSLLEPACRSEGEACTELGSLHEEGYFGVPDPRQARLHFERAAPLGHRRGWKELARYYRQGLGGPRDDAEAYFWVALEARCVHPDSVSGGETGAQREQIAADLSLVALRREWQRIDATMVKVLANEFPVYPRPYDVGNPYSLDEPMVKESRALAEHSESEHREHWSRERAAHFRR